MLNKITLALMVGGLLCGPEQLVFLIPLCSLLALVSSLPVTWLHSWVVLGVGVWIYQAWVAPGGQLADHPVSFIVGPMVAGAFGMLALGSLMGKWFPADPRETDELMFFA